MDNIPQALIERICFEPNTGCWIWFGARNREGYGSLRVNQKTIGAHRHVYWLMRGTVPMELHHICEVKCCVNPDHLEGVTRREHRQKHPEQMRRAQMVAHEEKRQRAHCKQGHPFVGRNVIWRKDRPGTRDCRACMNEAQRRRKLRLASIP